MEKEIYCVWHCPGYQTAEKEFEDLIDIMSVADMSERYKAEKNYDLCVSKKVLLASFESEERAEEFITLFSSGIKKDCFISVENLNK